MASDHHCAGPPDDVFLDPGVEVPLAKRRPAISQERSAEGAAQAKPNR
jgi:hypothetical protein